MSQTQLFTVLMAEGVRRVQSCGLLHLVTKICIRPTDTQPRDTLTFSLLLSRLLWVLMPPLVFHQSVNQGGDQELENLVTKLAILKDLLSSIEKKVTNQRSLFWCVHV